MKNNQKASLLPAAPYRSYFIRCNKSILCSTKKRSLKVFQALADEAWYGLFFFKKKRRNIHIGVSKLLVNKSTSKKGKKKESLKIQATAGQANFHGRHRSSVVAITEVAKRVAKQTSDANCIMSM